MIGGLTTIMAAANSGGLPFYQRYVNGVPVPGRKTLRLREKYIILLVLCTFSIVCMCAFMYLPNLHDKVSMEEMRKRLQDEGEGLFIPQMGADGRPPKGKILRHPGNDEDGEDVHNSNDKKILDGKIVTAWEKQKLNEELVKQMKLQPEEAKHIKKEIQKEKEVLLNKQREENEKQQQVQKEVAKQVIKDHDGHPGARGKV